MEDAFERGGLARAGAAGDDQHAFARHGFHGLALLGAQAHLLPRLDLGDGALGEGLRVAAALEGAQQPRKAKGGVGLGLVVPGQVDRRLAVDVLGLETAGEDEAAQGVVDEVFVGAEHLPGALDQERERQVHVAGSVAGLVERVAQAALQAKFAGEGKAHRQRHAVGGLEAHALHLVGEAVGVFAGDGFRALAVGAVDARGHRRREAVFLQKHHRAAHLGVFLKALGDHGGALFADAGHFGEALRLGGEHVQRALAETFDDELRRGRADAADEAGSKVLFDAVQTLGAHGLHPGDADLAAIFAVLHQFALEGGALAGQQHGHRPHRGQMLAALELDLRHGEAVFIVSIGDLFHDAFKSGHGRPPEASSLLLQPQKPLFRRQPAGVADQGAVAPDDAVAGDEQRQGVAVVGAAHGAAGLFVAEGAGDVYVGARFAIGYLAHFLPDAQLEGRALRGEGHVEIAALAGEVFLEFALGKVQHRTFMGDGEAAEARLHQRPAAGDERHRADGRFHIAAGAFIRRFFHR